MPKDRSTTCAAGAKQVEPYLLGKDPARSSIIGRPFTGTHSIAAGRS